MCGNSAVPAQSWDLEYMGNIRATYLTCLCESYVLPTNHVFFGSSRLCEIASSRLPETPSIGLRVRIWECVSASRDLRARKCTSQNATGLTRIHSKGIKRREQDMADILNQEAGGATVSL